MFKGNNNAHVMHENYNKITSIKKHNYVNIFVMKQIIACIDYNIAIYSLQK